MRKLFELLHFNQYNTFFKKSEKITQQLLYLRRIKGTNKMEMLNCNNVTSLKKNLETMKDSYDPKEVESKWYEFWEENGYFKPHLKDAEKKEKFAIILPPPNITGSLHIGHTLTVAIQDALVRYKRMKRFVTVYIPGTDHAGIATQTVVEKMLYKNEKKIRQDYGREAFVEKIYEWRDTYGHIIKNQIRRIGASVDWSREYFTMDPVRSKAVQEAFIKFFESGLIYRDNRLVAWCPFLKTALSDIEVQNEEIKKPTKVKIPGYDYLVEVGVLYKFFYPVKDSEEKIEVATTRIETMLGDVAVAVHPKDKRYTHLVGKELVHPFVKDRTMRVIADEYVDMEFGTGAVKITPAHDKNDYEMMKRHNLSPINIFTLDGRINEQGGELFKGMHRFECRFKIQEELKKLNLLSDKIPNEMSLPTCSRTNDIIEYMLIPQWYLNCNQLAAEAVQCVKRGDLKIIPQQHNQTWFYWLENVKDWCISRQLWWGHRIPAYKIITSNKTNENDSNDNEKELWVVARSKEEAKVKAKELVQHEDFELVQDEDVLDTWFSSSLLPFTTLGWPERKEEYDMFFPNTLLETGQDILFFWVARMVMVSLHLTGKLPFHTIYLHAMIRDSKGEKMSKSKGNVVDPLDIINGICLQDLHAKLYTGNLPEKEIKKAIELQKKEFPKGIPECGTDALRFGLLTYLKQGRNVNLDINRIIGYRHFCNKLWNCVKFFLKTIPDHYDAKFYEQKSVHVEKGTLLELLNWEDRWILHKLNEFIKNANENFEAYNFSEVAFSAYNFWLYELCDIYLELIKTRFYGESSTIVDGEVKKEKREEMEVESVSNKTENANKNNENALFATLTLHMCLEYGLRLLHPISPFITEELYQKIQMDSGKQKHSSISTTDYPTFNTHWKNDRVESEMNIFMDIVKQFRSFISNLEIPPKTKLICYVAAKEKEDKLFLQKVKTKIQTLAKLSSLEIIPYDNSEWSNEMNENLKKCLKDIVSHKFIIYVQSSEEYLKPLLTTMQNKQKKLQNSLESYMKKVNDPNYEKKVPQEVRDLYVEKMDQLKSQIADVSKIILEIEDCLKN